MGMPIDDAIEVMEYLKTQNPQLKSIDVAIDAMKKYQKIQAIIVEHWACCGNPSDSMIAISEVIIDGEID